MYRRYHYLTHDLNKAARCFELFEGDVPVAFLAVLHQPTKQRLDLKRVSRLVVLPDYQGIGIGRAFLDTVAAMYVSEGHMFEIKTSARNLIHSLRSDPDWRLSRYGFSHAGGATSKAEKRDTIRTDCKTATFKRARNPFAVRGRCTTTAWGIDPRGETSTRTNRGGDCASIAR